MTSFLHDLRYASRIFRHNPGFAIIAVLTLALGIGATTAIFSVIYGVLLRPLPYRNAEQIVRLWEQDAAGNRMNFADPNFEDVRGQARSLQGIAEYTSSVETVQANTLAMHSVVAAVSKDFFSVMGATPVLGRSFAQTEQTFGAAPAAVLAYDYWIDHFAGETNLAALRLNVEDHDLTVVGVMPAGFAFPDEAEIWVPRELYESLPSRTAHNWKVVGRLKEGVTLVQARAELSGIGQRIKLQNGEDVDLSDIAASTLRSATTRGVRPTLLVLLGSVAFLLLIACANVANLTLAQAAARSRELAVRSALGANRLRLVRQFLTENLTLSLLGGALGIVFAIWGVNFLLLLAPQNLPRLRDVSVDWPVLLFALGLTIVVALGLGFFSALRATSGKLQQAVAEGDHRQAGSLREGRLGRFLVTGQVGAALILLVGAGLLGRSLLRVLSVDPGFRTERIATLDLAFPPVHEEADKIRRVAFINQLFSRLRALPGVVEVGGTACLPLTDYRVNGTFLVVNTGDKLPRSPQEFDKLFRNPAQTGQAVYCATSGSYFQALGIPVVRGRLFDERDTLSAPHVALISESLAKKRWPGQDPIGKQIEFGNMDGDIRLLTIVGVVGDVHANSLEIPPSPTIYVSYTQRPQSTQNFTVVMRSAGDTMSVLPASLNVMRNLDPNLPPRLGTFLQVFSSSLASRRFSLILVGMFSFAALILAAGGTYGVTAYAVSRRTREFGVRMAVGATRKDILRLVLAQGALPTLWGCVFGIAGAAMLTRLLQNLLFGVGTLDPLTYGAVAVLLAAVTALACSVPALRAARVDPTVALRYE